jgi:type IV conjugative transfer system coupling protein TraD
MSLAKAFTQGGQVTLHNLRMIRQVLGVTLGTTLILSFLFFGIKSWTDTTAYQKQVATAYAMAKFKVGFPIGDPLKHTQNFPLPSGNFKKVRAIDVIQSAGVLHQVTGVKQMLWKCFIQMLGVMGGTLLFFIGFWIWRGKSRKAKEILSGTHIVSPNQLKRLIRRRGETSPFNLAGVPLIKNKELQHLLIVGTTGAGKTNSVNELLQQIREKKQRAVIVDVTGGFIERFYRPGIDKILNPLDERLENWNVWGDCSKSFHFDTLAAALVPSKHDDDFWVNSARTLFTSTAQILQELQNNSVCDLLDYAVYKPLAEAAPFYAGTPAASFMDIDADKTAIGVRSTLGVNIKCLELLKETDSPFSIREWMKEEEGDSWLFLASVPEMREVLKPLLTAWTTIATNALMSLNPSSERRVWFIMDELPALKKLPELHTMLAEARKYGGCVVAGTQDMSLLDEAYGHHLVKSITNLCSTKLVFRIAGADIAERVSKWLGSQEVSEAIENISYGAHQMRDGVSLNDQRREKTVVNPDKLMKLPDLEAYLKVPGDYPVAKVRFRYHNVG